MQEEQRDTPTRGGLPSLRPLAPPMRAHHDPDGWVLPEALEELWTGWKPSYLMCIRFSSMLHGFLGVTGTGIPCCCR